jgi:hypothetical protein
MLKTLDVLIGATTVLLLFSLAVTVITQALTSLAGRRGRHLRAGLTHLLQQLGMLLLDLASGTGAQKLEGDAQAALKKALEEGGIKDPDQALKNIRAMALQLEASNPGLPNQVRDGLAILHEAPSDFVARVNSWFDQTIDRVSLRFTHYTHWITMGVAVGVVLAVQLDIIAVADRLWIDDQFRGTIVSEATRQFSQSAAASKVDPHPYYDLLNSTALITLPLDHDWPKRLMDVRKVPGMVLAVLLMSLGAPFWYNALKNLLKLRSTLSEKDDAQRAQRQAAPTGGGSASLPDSTTSVSQPAWLSGERGDLAAVG